MPSRSLANNNLQLIRHNTSLVKKLYPNINRARIQALKELTKQFNFSFASGDVIQLENGWYRNAHGTSSVWRGARDAAVSMSSPSIHCVIPQPVVSSSRQRCIRPRIPPVSSGMATLILPMYLYSSAVPRCAWPRRVPSTARCARHMASGSARSRRLDPIRVRCAGSASEFPPSNGKANGNGAGHKVRDRLCQIIRQHKLDPELVKAYAVDFCGTKALKDATREQVESFVQQLADAAAKDRSALLCHLNSYAQPNQEVIA